MSLSTTMLVFVILAGFCDNFVVVRQHKRR